MSYKKYNKRDTLDPRHSDEVKWRTKKNTKRWCKGKPGVLHEPATVFNEKNYSPENRSCGESQWYVWRNSKKEPIIHWQCYHHVVCINCNKILEFMIPKESCPDWIDENEKDSTDEREFAEGVCGCDESVCACD